MQVPEILLSDNFFTYKVTRVEIVLKSPCSASISLLKPFPFGIDSLIEPRNYHLVPKPPRRWRTVEEGEQSSLERWMAKVGTVWCKIRVQKLINNILDQRPHGADGAAAGREGRVGLEPLAGRGGFCRRVSKNRHIFSGIFNEIENKSFSFQNSHP